MRRGTTPTIEMKVNGVEFSDVEKWYVTIEQDEYQITKTNDDIEIDEEKGAIIVPLSQTETLDMRRGKVQIQLRLVLVDGNIIASEINTIDIEPILYDEEI